MTALRAWWNRFWFEPASPANLGVCRALFFGLLSLLYWNYDFSAWASVSGAFWMPTLFFRAFHVPVLSREQLDVVQVVWKVALGLSCIGLLTRLSTLVAFLLGAYLLGLLQCFGRIQHGEAIPVLVMGILLFARCGDGWSLDRLLATRRRGNGPGAGSFPPCGEYTWPIRMVWVALTLVFFAAGLAKLRHSGLAWAAPDNMELILLETHYLRGRTNPLVSWGLYLAQYGWACRVLAATTMALELGYPLALVSRRARWVLVPGSCGMLIGIRVLMGPAFPQLLICSLFWVPWDLLGARLRETWSGATKAIVATKWNDPRGLHVEQARTAQP